MDSCGKMKVIQNVISRDWIIKRNGKTYTVNFTFSDGQTLALCNRGYWEVWDTESGELTESAKIGDELVNFCKKELTKELVKNIDWLKELKEFGVL